MKEELRELRKDFKESLSEINFKEYDPFSKKFMKASFIGQMWLLMKMLHDDDEVEEELDGAKKYFDRYKESGDTAFAGMAKDELKHAGILIKKHYEWADEEKKKHLEAQENERQELMSQIEKFSSLEKE